MCIGKLSNIRKCVFFYFLTETPFKTKHLLDLVAIGAVRRRIDNFRKGHYDYPLGDESVMTKSVNQ